MSISISLQIFSGRPNPRWELSEDLKEEFLNRLRKFDKSTLLKPPVLLSTSRYKGFSIKTVNENSLPQHIYIYSGIVEQFNILPNLITESADFEKWLLSTSGNTITDDIKDFITNEMDKTIDWVKKLSMVDSPFLAPIPYNPDFWNSDKSVCCHNNCYNYATDKQNNTYAQPGYGSGRPLETITLEAVKKASMSDGLVPVIDTTGPLNPDEHFIALVFDPGPKVPDFHWYRLDDNHKWSHEQGEFPVTNRDYSNNEIASPESCNRGSYTEWGGYFRCNRSTVTISGSGNPHCKS